MSGISFYIINILHAILILVLLYYVCRLLLTRKTASGRLHYAAGLFLLVNCLEAGMYLLMDNNVIVNVAKEQTIAIIMDLLAAITGFFMAAVLIRNRFLYSQKVIYTACTLLLLLLAAYIVCWVFDFSDQTRLFYLPFSALIWGTFGYVMDRATPEEPEMKISEEEISDPFMQQLNRMLLENKRFCQKDLKRDELCALMRTNRTYFSQQLKAATGRTFSEYLRDLRLAEAARLLRETDLYVKEIVQQVGLSSTSGFYKSFFLSYGTTPDAYRAKCRNTAN